MTYIIIPSRSRRLPLGPVRLNRRSELVQNLKALWVPYHASTSSLVELVSGSVDHGTNMVGQTMAMNADGSRGLRLTISNDYVNGGARAVNAVTTQHISVMALIVPTVTTRGDILCRWNTGGTAGDQFNLLYGLTSGKARFYSSNGGTTWNSGDSTTTMAVDKPYMIGGGVVGTTNIDVFVNGVKENTAVPGGLMTAAPTTNYRIGDNVGAAGNFTGFFFFGAVWDEQLDATLYREVYANPYQLVEAARTKLYFIPAAAATSSVTFAGSGALAAVGKENAAASAAFAGVGSFAGVGKELAKASAAFAGVGSFAVVGSTAAAATGSVALAGSGSLSAVGKELAKASTAFSGTGSMSAVGKALAKASSALAGSGSFAPAGSVSATASGAVAFAGTGAFAPAGKTLFKGTATFAGLGSFAPVGGQSGAGTVSFAGSATFSPVGATLAKAAAAFAGAASFAPVGQEFAKGNVSFAGLGAFAPAGQVSAQGVGVVTFAGLGAFAPVATAIAAGSVAFGGSGGIDVQSTGAAAESSGGRVGPAPPRRIHLVPIIARVHTGQSAQTVRARATLTLVVVSVRTRQAGQGVEAQTTMELDGQVATASAAEIRAFVGIRMLASGKSWQGWQGGMVAANASIVSKVTSGIFPRDPPPTYDGPPSWAPDDMPSSFRNAA